MLPPGLYQFAIKAANSDNVWSEEEVTLNFQVTLPFHRTTWFYIFSAFILSLAATILLGYRKWKSRIKELRKYSSSTLTDDKAEEYLEKLIALVEGEQYFTKPDLSLSLLARELSIPPSHLSQIINRKLEKNFNNFVNKYRIEEAKKRLLNPEFDHLKVTSIGSDVGFKSKSAFYSAFKKQTGMNPSDFRSAHGS
jgi:YesN/AraC family two-component response regulator